MQGENPVLGRVRCADPFLGDSNSTEVILVFVMVCTADTTRLVLS